MLSIKSRKAVVTCFRNIPTFKKVIPKVKRVKFQKSLRRMSHTQTLITLTKYLISVNVTK